MGPIDDPTTGSASKQGAENKVVIYEHRRNTGPMTTLNTDEAPESPPFNGETLARMALADFADFFLPGHELVIPLKVGRTRGHASAVSLGPDRWIAISTIMAQDEIDSRTNLIFHLLIIGHEIAHIVHEHTYAGDQDDEDYSALEFWADFYGTKAMMTLITFGSRISNAFCLLHSDKKRLDHIGKAVEKMVNGGIYNINSKYPAPLVRAGLVNNGVASFLRHNMGTNFHPTMYENIFRYIMSGASLQNLIDSDVNQDVFSLEPINRIMEWHRKRQGERNGITLHFKPNLIPYLHTTFNQTEEEFQKSKIERLKEIQAAGYLKDVKPSDF